MIKKAISNIAWTNNIDTKQLYYLLRKYDISGIECAPGKIITDIETVSTEQLKSIRNKYLNEGFSIPSFQSICYNRPELQVFDRSTHKAFYKHIENLARCAEELGVTTLVFGSPKNRIHNSSLLDNALDVAIEFFNTAGDIVQNHGCYIGIEANPAQYGGNFLLTSLEVQKFISAYLHSDGVRFHYDSGADILNASNYTETLSGADDIIHCHFSAPMLYNLNTVDFDYHNLFKFFDNKQYSNWISIEMRNSTENELEYIEQALKTAFGDIK